MTELFDFGRYAPFIAASYGASVVVLGFLIAHRRAQLAKARANEQRKAGEKATPD